MFVDVGLETRLEIAARKEGRKEGSVLFNDSLNTFYVRLYGRKEGRKCFI